MLDFLLISTRSSKRGRVEVYPKFIIKKSSDLMIRGRDFYAVWVEDRKLWSTDEQDALGLIDRELDEFAEDFKKKVEDEVRVLHMWDADSGMIDNWHKYCQKQMRDSFHPLDGKLIFANQETEKKDYASKKLPYPLEKGECPSWEKLISTLYLPEERKKIEWAIGSIVAGESGKLHKFIVLYGEIGTGKSTVLNVISKLFEGYCSVFDAKSLGSSTNAFAFEMLRSNPLVGIQHEGDLSHIEDNTKLNSLVSHEPVMVNEKFKAAYENRFRTFLFMGSNKPVKITDAKSGLLRRLIDVAPSGNKLPQAEYKRVMKQIEFELGAIAYRCRELYLSEPDAYDNYIPIAMLGATNDFYNFVLDSYLIFKRDDGVSLKAAWEMYKSYCDDAKVQYPYSQRVFKEELKNYFREYSDRFSQEDGSRIRSWYGGFLSEKIEGKPTEPIPAKPDEKTVPDWLTFEARGSPLDYILADCPAQEARVTDDGKEVPSTKWENVKATLKDIDTSKVHYVKPPFEHIVVDLDIPDEDGNKCLTKNIEAASKFPPTYAELSKSGQGIHLHYIYDGDPLGLSRVFDDHIEIKIFSGNSSLRRKLTKCNGLDVAHISSGLPLKGETKMLNFDSVKSEKGLRTLIKRNLNKEIHPNTKPSVEFIKKILDEAYEGGLKYDVSDMEPAIISFAAKSTHNSAACLKMVAEMKFKSDEMPEPENYPDEENGEIIFFDVEVFVNLFVLCFKKEGDSEPVSLINPTSKEIETLLTKKLVGFNCRRYDNHILYGRLLGYTNEQLYSLSQRIVKGEKQAFFGEAYDLSYTDIYDFSSEKQSLKKFEIDLGIHHQELGLPWDEPVPEELWPKVAEYCKNDVVATEAVWKARQADFTAREILAKLTGMTVNDTTNSLTARFIFGAERKPQGEFNYRNLGDTSDVVESDIPFYTDYEDEYTKFNSKGQPVFPGYIYDKGKSVYRGEEVGEGGYVYAEPGIYHNVALLDIASMHPSSVIAENLFGKYTERFKALKDARLAIKHKDFDTARTMLDGALAPFLTDESQAKSLAQALKIVINAVYGLTSAKFDNPFHDPRNADNIVAKRGALFMVNLKHMVQAKGFTVAHIKTDSIKIPDATPEIISFVTNYGKMYGYDFEHEATYDRICLVNNAVYIAKYDGADGKWTATGTQFAVPYVFKTLFSHEPIEFGDMCETKSVTTALYLDFNENLPEGEHNRHFVGRVGLFCPVISGAGGGELLREGKDKDRNKKYDSATGCKGRRWMEAEMVKTLGKEDYIDKDYYAKLVDAAVETIGKYGDVEQFCG